MQTLWAPELLNYNLQLNQIPMAQTPSQVCKAGRGAALEGVDGHHQASWLTGSPAENLHVSLDSRTCLCHPISEGLAPFCSEKLSHSQLYRTDNLICRQAPSRHMLHPESLCSLDDP